jgi:6-pyruvoyltetrahydropterin/6-carboxytetrahydropterin synthase
MTDESAVTVPRTFTFDAAHVLPWHPGKCARLHGHTYRLEVSLTDRLDRNGIVVDFDDLKRDVWIHALDQLDHAFLNDVMNNLTAERIALFTLDSLKSAGHPVSLTRLWETPECFVAVRP